MGTLIVIIVSRNYTCGFPLQSLPLTLPHSMLIALHRQVRQRGPVLQMREADGEASPPLRNSMPPHYTMESVFVCPPATFFPCFYVCKPNNILIWKNDYQHPLPSLSYHMPHAGRLGLEFSIVISNDQQSHDGTPTLHPCFWQRGCKAAEGSSHRGHIGGLLPFLQQ